MDEVVWRTEAQKEFERRRAHFIKAADALVAEFMGLAGALPEDWYGLHFTDLLRITNLATA
jgi:hypothetical protein